VAEQRTQRRLAAIVAADVVGYSRLMGADEEGTLARLNQLRRELLHPKVTEYNGRIVKTTGDGTLIEFPSAVDAVQHAVDVQQSLASRNADLPKDHRIEIRMGINLGDIIVEDEDIFGEGVNVAARLEGIAEPGGICLSAIVHESVRTKLDVAFTDAGEQLLKNIAEPVHVYRVALDGSNRDSEDISGSHAMFRRPTVAVLPFENLSGDPEQEYFADGLTEDIIIALSLWKSFPVIARNSTFAYKGASPDIRKVGEELGARYVIEGSVRAAGNRVRVTAQLINAENGHHVWAERFDRDLSDIFDLQDELSQSIATIIAPELEFSQAPEMRTQTPQNLDAWALVQRGYEHMWALDVDKILAARKFFEQAIELDPDYARAHSGLAFSYHRELWLGHGEFSGETKERFVNAANRAVELDDSDASGHIHLCMALFWCHDLDRGIAEVKRAIELNPNNAHAFCLLGHGLALAGQPEEGVPFCERGIRLGPRDPRQGIWMWNLAKALLTARRYEDAVDWSKRAIQRHPNNPDAHLVLASGLGHLERLEEATSALDTYRRLLPRKSERPHFFWRYKNESDYEHFLEGLHVAGWEG
jgi:adenylate cyclase